MFKTISFICVCRLNYQGQLFYNTSKGANLSLQNSTPTQTNASNENASIYVALDGGDKTENNISSIGPVNLAGLSGETTFSVGPNSSVYAENSGYVHGFLLGEADPDTTIGTPKDYLGIYSADATLNVMAADDVNFGVTASAYAGTFGLVSSAAWTTTYLGGTAQVKLEFSGDSNNQVIITGGSGLIDGGGSDTYTSVVFDHRYGYGSTAGLTLTGIDGYDVLTLDSGGMGKGLVAA